MDSGRGGFRPLVAFDFDGTLTCRDSFIDFLLWRVGPARFAFGLARLAPQFAAYGLDRDRGALKAAVVGEFLAGTSREALAELAERHVAERARRLFRPDALRCWHGWRKRGARLVIVTASPEILVAPFAHDLGAEKLIGTRLVFFEEQLLGALDGPNCRGEEKARRLREVFGETVRLEAAYGDSDGDEAMLAMADKPGMKIFGGRP